MLPEGQESLRAVQLALRNNRRRPDFFQAGGRDGQRSEKKVAGDGGKRKRAKEEDGANDDDVCGPSLQAGPRPASSQTVTNKKCRKELMVIEQHDHLPTEEEPLFGHVVWAQFGNVRSYYPALVIKGSMVNLSTADVSQSFVFWFSDKKVSAVDRDKLLDFVSCFKEKGSRFLGKKTRNGVLAAIEELKRRAELGRHSSLDINLVKWAQSGFPIKGRPAEQVFKPDPEDCFPENIVKRLEAIGADIRLKASKKDRDIPNEFYEENAIVDVWEGRRNIVDVCIACGDQDKRVTCKHPLFEGGLCNNCKEILQETFYAVEDDGSHSHCAVCGTGGEMFVCDSQDCGRVFCVACVQEMGGSDVLDQVKSSHNWLCFLCQPYSPDTHGILKPVADWRNNMVLFYDMGHGTSMVPDLDYFKDRRRIRVLSLFDGIGTGMLALRKAGLVVEVYYASEIDQEAAMISQLNHGDVIIPLGDIANITRDKLAELVPIDLLIGGSPCNELSLANPLRKGFDAEGSGVLFFDFYRILRDLSVMNGTTHLFWLFENVTSMRTAYRTVISRFLQCQPAVWDAKHVSAQKRSRFFWGNIPGLYSTPEVSVALRREKDLNSVLTAECRREATVRCVRTIATQSNSLLQGSKQKTLPVAMAGRLDTLWLTELERLFGFPAHYTDVCNLPLTKRRALLGRSWSVQVVTEILKPLAQFFANTDNNHPAQSSANITAAGDGVDSSLTMIPDDESVSMDVGVDASEPKGARDSSENVSTMVENSGGYEGCWSKVSDCDSYSNTSEPFASCKASVLTSDCRTSEPSVEDKDSTVLFSDNRDVNTAFVAGNINMENQPSAIDDRTNMQNTCPESADSRKVEKASGVSHGYDLPASSPTTKLCTTARRSKCLDSSTSQCGHKATPIISDTTSAGSVMNTKEESTIRATSVRNTACLASTSAITGTHSAGSTKTLSDVNSSGLAESAADVDRTGSACTPIDKVVLNSATTIQLRSRVLGPAGSTDTTTLTNGIDNNTLGLSDLPRTRSRMNISSHSHVGDVVGKSLEKCTAGLMSDGRKLQEMRVEEVVKRARMKEGDGQSANPATFCSAAVQTSHSISQNTSAVLRDCAERRDGSRERMSAQRHFQSANGNIRRAFPTAASRHSGKCIPLKANAYQRKRTRARAGLYSKDSSAKKCFRPRLEHGEKPSSVTEREQLPAPVTRQYSKRVKMIVEVIKQT